MVWVTVRKVVGAFAGAPAATVTGPTFADTDASVGPATSTETAGVLSAAVVVAALFRLVVAAAGAGEGEFPPTCATRAFLAACA